MEAGHQYDWSITPEKVERAVRLLVEAARPRRIILFGSWVRGETGRNSDLDIMVISGDEVEDPRRESVRLRRALRGLSMPIDIIVVPHGQWEMLKERPGMIYREAWQYGKVVYEAA